MRKAAHGFTLIELLVVIAILAILAIVTGLVLNPLELTKRARDATRLSDMATLQQGINIALQDATNSGTAAILCSGTSAPCSGDSNTGSRKNDGTGWVKVNLTTVKSVSVPTLQVDPINDNTNKYTYFSDGTNFELNAVLESQQYQPKMLTAGDGGDNDARYEVGTDLKLMN